MVVESCFAPYRDWFVGQVSKTYYEVTNVCSSPQGDIIIASDSRGSIAVFSLSKYLSADYWLSTVVPQSPTSVYHFKAHYSNIHTLLSTPEYIISACESDLNIWKWDSILSQVEKQEKLEGSSARSLFIDIKPDHSLSLRSKKVFLGYNDSLWYIGYDGVAYNITNPLTHDAESQISANQEIPSLPGTQATSLVSRSEKILIIGYDDGKVRIWDSGVLSYEILENMIKPIKEPLEKYIRQYKAGKNQMKAEREHRVLCLQIDASGDWLIVGTSANYCSIWNISLMEFTNCIPVAGSPSKILFNGTDILSVGSEEFVYHWNIVGKYKTRVQTSSSSILDIHINQSSEEKFRVLLACGNSDQLDVFSNFNHKGFSFQFPQ